MLTMMFAIDWQSISVLSLTPPCLAGVSVSAVLAVKVPTAASARFFTLRMMLSVSPRADAAA
jgi:hypothetical protein